MNIDIYTCWFSQRGIYKEINSLQIVLLFGILTKMKTIVETDYSDVWWTFYPQKCYVFIMNFSIKQEP